MAPRPATNIAGQVYGSAAGNRAIRAMAMPRWIFKGINSGVPGESVREWNGYGVCNSPRYSDTGADALKIQLTPARTHSSPFPRNNIGAAAAETTVPHSGQRSRVARRS